MGNSRSKSKTTTTTTSSTTKDGGISASKAEEPSVNGTGEEERRGSHTDREPADPRTTEEAGQEESGTVPGDDGSAGEVAVSPTAASPSEDSTPPRSPSPAHSEQETPQIEDGVPAAVIGDTNGTEPEDVSSAQIAADDSSQYVPRLCNLCKWPNFDGYGFNLHAEKDKPGQYIGLVDADSPAEVGGLREGDRIIEVNGDNIESFNHTVVIQKIKSGGDKTSMLVVDKATDDYYKSRGQTVASSMANVMVISTPSRESVVDTALEQQEAGQVAAYSWQQEDPPAYPDDLASGAEQALPDPPQHGEWDVEADSGVPEPNVSLSDTEEATESVRAEVTEAVESAPVPEDSYIVHNGTEEVAGGVAAVAVADDDDVVVAAQQEVQESVGGAGSVEYNAYEEVEVTASPPDPTPVSYQEDLGTAANGMNGGSVGDVQGEAGVVSQTSQAEPAVIATPSSGEDLNLNLSAAEMKERLKSRKKQDPRQSKTSFETKYKMFEKM